MLVRYRLDELSKELEEFRSRTEGWHAALGAGNTHLQSEFLSWRIEIRDQYILQRDADVRYATLNARLEEMVRQARQYEQEVARHYAQQRELQTRALSMDEIERYQLRTLAGVIRL